MAQLINIVGIPFLLLGAAVALETPSFAAAAPPPTVNVTVTASDTQFNPLYYKWQVTDGTIVGTSGASMTWRLPSGPGLHFAYVLVSNGKGGYTERRIAVNTDIIGVPLEKRRRLSFKARAAPKPFGNPYRSVLRSGYYVSPTTDISNGIYKFGAQAYLDNNNGFKTPIATSDRRGYFDIQQVPPGTYDLHCRRDAASAFEVCDTDITIGNEAAYDAFQGNFGSTIGQITGRVTLKGGRPCGINSEFFGIGVSATAELHDSSDAIVAGPTSTNEAGQYEFPANASAVSVVLKCEGAAPLRVGVPDSNTTFPASLSNFFADSEPPIVSNMSAKLNGSEVGLFLPPPAGLPSDSVPFSDFFLSYKGIDNRASACAYYLAIGAVKTCDAAGMFTKAISFDDWKRATRMEPYLLKGAKEYKATFINRVDLNLTRKHHSVSYSNNRTAAYVCNHLGPSDESQAAADVAISNAIANKNLVACVAMDYSITRGVNGNKPFVRFLIFGPDGRLLPSINLDGRQEKFVPGVCVACHGGDRYADHFPTAAFGRPGAGSADIGAHFVPYDTGNFVFSSKAGLTESEQEEAIYNLNQNVLRAGPNLAIQELINGWYANSHVLNKHYTPASWASASAPELRFYQKVYASSCRTCHVAMSETLNFDRYSNFVSGPQWLGRGMTRTSLTTCGGSTSWWRNFSMPNSLRTFDLFWATRGAVDDQPSIVQGAVATSSAPVDSCDLFENPTP